MVKTQIDWEQGAEHVHGSAGQFDLALCVRLLSVSLTESMTY